MQRSAEETYISARPRSIPKDQGDHRCKVKMDTPKGTQKEEGKQGQHQGDGLGDCWNHREESCGVLLTCGRFEIFCLSLRQLWSWCFCQV